MNKQQLASAIWEAANKMRSKIEANEYKDYILGFIFYKFLSDNEEKHLRNVSYYCDEDIEALLSDSQIEKLRESKSEEELADILQNLNKEINTCIDDIGYFIPYDYLFSTWLKKGSDFNVGDVRDALSSFSRHINKSHAKVFDKIFNTLETGLSKLGESAGAQTKAVSDLIHLIQRIPMDEKQDYDVLGFIYEYLISNFAANAGKKAGEFYTPHEVSLLMSEIVAEHLKDRKEISIYDPTSGSGSLLINIGKAIAKHNDNKDSIKYYAQELKENTYNLTRMNLVMRGIIPANIFTRNGDTLENDWPYFEESDPERTYNPLFVDAVVSNPPYSQNWDPADKATDARFKSYGVAPKSKADYAFLLHDLYHLRDDGIMTIVLPHGVLFRGGEEGEIRKNLIEHNNIDAIIGLPANIFFGTGIPTIIMVLKKQRSTSDVLIIDASKGFVKEGKNNKLRACDIKKITDVISGRLTIDKYSQVVSRDEIRANGWNLNIPRYVDSSGASESWDIYATMFGGIPDSEIDEFSEYWDSFPSLRRQIFVDAPSGPYSNICTEDIHRTIMDNADVKDFVKSLENKIELFSEYLDDELIKNMDKIDIPKEENRLSEILFSKIEDYELIDKYDAYQILDEEWNEIAIDLEIIQTEGFEAVSKVDPRMIVKKKDGKEIEVQDGWIGHVLPFELVQENLLCDKVKSIDEINVRLQNIQSEYEEVIEELSEENKQDYVNEAGNAPITAVVSAKIKELKKDKNPDEDGKILFAQLSKLDSLSKEEKELRSNLKKETTDLELTTKNTIESLSSETALQLLRKKWIDKISRELVAISGNLLKDFSSKLSKLIEKYSETYADISNQIDEISKELSELIEQLTGNEFDMKGLEELKELLR